MHIGNTSFEQMVLIISDEWSKLKTETMNWITSMHLPLPFKELKLDEFEGRGVNKIRDMMNELNKMWPKLWCEFQL